MANLYQKYRDEIRPKLQKDLDIKNPMAVPKITKITINMGVGEAIADRKVMEAAVADDRDRGSAACGLPSQTL